MSCGINTREIPVPMIGLETSLKGVYEEIQSIAPHNISCLITGESGTGKEMVAQLIHALSPRKQGPFIAVNCASIPAELFESELFGYEKGAFTGANSPKQGLIELANKGTLFLDEIGELPIHVQPKLLRVLNDKRLYRVGGTREISVDFRLIAATNVDLSEAIKQNKFRNDLFHRISDFIVALPPLRSRQEDLEPLIQFLSGKAARRLNIQPVPITKEALTFLRKQTWPGNIRQLEKILTRALVVNKNRESISLKIIEKIIENKEYDYNTAIHYICENIRKKKTPFKEIEKDIVFNLIKQYDNNIQLAAEETGYSLQKLYRVLRNSKNGGEEDFQLFGGKRILRITG